jgi:hypothetical protein
VSGSGATYTPQESDVGRQISCSLTVSASFSVLGQTINLGSISSVVTPAKTIAAKNLSVVSPPTITGTAQEGQTVTCASGAWDPANFVTDSIQWLRGSSVVSTGATRLLTADDANQQIKCRQNVSRLGKTSSQESAARTVAAKPADPDPNPGGGGNNTGGGNTNTGNTNTNTGGNTQGTTPTNNALANRRALARKRAAAIKKCKTKFRKASQRKKRAACVKKAKKRFRVR